MANDDEKGKPKGHFGDPELTDPPDTSKEEEAIQVGNEPPIPTTTEETILNDDGTITRRKTDHKGIAPDGRIIKPEEIVGISWTGQAIPTDMLFSCFNPFGDHEYRLVYLNIDGFVTDLGNILCIECFDKNKARAKLRKWLWMIYRPEIF